MLGRTPRRKRRSTIDGVFRYFRNLHASDALLLGVAALVFIASLVTLAVMFSQRASVEVAAHGGMLTEGIVGTPRFINPVLAVTRADKDMASLVYAGVARLAPDGTLVPDVADSITISEDGLVYNIILREDVAFHDGTPLTSEDIAYTIAQIQNPQLASPLRASWDGVVVEVVSPTEINFVLNEAYAPFIENLTVGILPRHIWKDATSEDFPFSQHNSEPIGAGPYMLKNIVRNTSGIPDSYVLTAYKDYHLGTPQIATLTLNFYQNEDTLVAAFNARKIDGAAGLSPQALTKLVLQNETHELITAPLPRTFAVFFNQNRSIVLRDLAARRALDAAIDREVLIDRVLKGYAAPLTSPVPAGFGDMRVAEPIESTTRLEDARAILRAGGWAINPDTGVFEKELDGIATPLSFNIATINTPIFTETADYLREEWQKLGATVEVKQFEQSDLTQAIIRPRDYQALLFGTVVGRSLDFYSFWHSSQQNDPGLNIALYANITTDAILEEARTSASSTERALAVQEFAAEIAKEVPALFLYNPEFTYVLPKHVTGTNFTGLGEPQERYASVHEWYIETDSVWKIFTNN